MAIDSVGYRTKIEIDKCDTDKHIKLLYVVIDTTSIFDKSTTSTLSFRASTKNTGMPEEKRAKLTRYDIRH